MILYLYFIVTKKGHYLHRAEMYKGEIISEWNIFQQTYAE